MTILKKDAFPSLHIDSPTLWPRYRQWNDYSIDNCQVLKNPPKRKETCVSSGDLQTKKKTMDVEDVLCETNSLYSTPDYGTEEQGNSNQTVIIRENTNISPNRQILQKRVENQKKRIRILQQKNRRQKKKIANLKQLLGQLKSRNLISSGAYDYLTVTYTFPINKAL